MEKRPSFAVLALVGVMAAMAAACNRTPPDTPPKTAGTTPPAPAARADVPGAAVAPSMPPATAPGASSGPVASSERAFVAEAANNGLAELEAARLVAGKSSSDTIRSFAQQLERDHASANAELQRVAGGKGITLPTTVDGEPMARLNRLRGLSGADLDRAFLQDFGIDAHQKAVALFERQAREGQDPDLRSFAERTLPQLRQHLVMAQQTQGNAPPASAGTLSGGAPVGSPAR